MNKTVFLLRGVSGAGKSTLAKKLASEWCIFEADKYLYEDGEYKWSPERMKDAHFKCFCSYMNYLEEGIGPLVVANTNTSEREFKKYIDAANEYGYTVISLIVENRHNGKDTHAVPETTLAAQEQRIKSSIKLR